MLFNYSPVITNLTFTIVGYIDVFYKENNQNIKRCEINYKMIDYKN